MLISAPACAITPTIASASFSFMETFALKMKREILDINSSTKSLGNSRLKEFALRIT